MLTTTYLSELKEEKRQREVSFSEADEESEEEEVLENEGDRFSDKRIHRPYTTVRMEKTRLEQLKLTLHDPVPSFTAITRNASLMKRKQQQLAKSREEQVTNVSYYIKSVATPRSRSKSVLNTKPMLKRGKQQSKKKLPISQAQIDRWKMIGVFNTSAIETFNIALIGNSQVGKKRLAMKFTDMMGPGFRAKNDGSLFYRFVKVSNQRIIEVNFSHFLQSDNSYTLHHLDEYIGGTENIDAIILCFRVDDMQSFRALTGSVADHVQRASHIPVFLCATRAETEPTRREVSFIQARQFCDSLRNCRGFFETSVVLKGDILGEDSDEEDFVATEDSSGGLDFLMHNVLKEIYNNRFNDIKDFSMTYLSVSGEETTPYIPQLEQVFIDVFSSSTCVDSISDFTYDKEDFGLSRSAQF
jgi:hypothetical protein